MAPSATPSLSLNASRDGDFATSRWSPFQYLITLSVKKFLPMFNLNLPWRSVGLCALVLSLAVKPGPPACTGEKGSLSRAVRRPGAWGLGLPVPCCRDGRAVRDSGCPQR